MNKKWVKIYTQNIPGQLLETKSFSHSVLPSSNLTALAIDENFSAFFTLR